MTSGLAASAPKPVQAIGACRADHGGADGEGNNQGALQRRALLGSVIRPHRLRGEPRRSHAQETKTPEKKVEDDRGGGDGTEKMRLSEPANHRHIGDAEERGRQMGERHRQREPGHAGVADLRRIFAGAFAGRHRGIHSAGVAHVQEPQHQPDRNDDHGSREDILGDVTDRVETKAPDAIDEIHDPAKNIRWADIEPHQKSADDQRHENKTQDRLPPASRPENVSVAVSSRGGRMALDRLE